ncbi:MAG: hypothetical protein GY934_23050 [Gammaproteobacteria bacterium]|nr:hypothetical protein [Gammaproteobacteria bacterium]
MNNKTLGIASIAIITIAIAVAIIYWLYSPATNEDYSKATVSSIPQSKADTKITEAKSVEVSDKIEPMDIDERLTPKVVARVRALENLARKSNGPVEFYGKVVDQHGDPIVGARISFELTATNESILLELLGGRDDMDVINKNEHINTVTDVNGGFSIQDKKGIYLTVVGIEKKGYMVQEIRDTIHFDATSSRRYRADARNRTIYQ